MTVPTPAPPPRPPSPHEDVARALAGLDGLADRPLAEHVEAFERVHAALGDALAAGPSAAAAPAGGA
ncbi:hypothetical protein [Pseudonocardia nigra]|uniref:hypothetical protein n=1 Tax=Pseudonocardia nigra TaxID=1921578 RepID=UPI001C5F88D0|nr:hypothetical protein [Pseudonocardia nigra]